MPMPTTVLRGNILFSALCQLPITPTSVAANTSAEQTFAFPGLLFGVDFVNVVKPSLTAGISIGNCRVSANNQIAITFTNSTASPIVPPAETYAFGVDRYEDAGLPFPAAIT